jgi:hypothetical protein
MEALEIIYVLPLANNSGSVMFVYLPLENNV